MNIKLDNVLIIPKEIVLMFTDMDSQHTVDVWCEVNHDGNIISVQQIEADEIELSENQKKRISEGVLNGNYPVPDSVDFDPRTYKVSTSFIKGN